MVVVVRLFMVGWVHLKFVGWVSLVLVGGGSGLVVVGWVWSGCGCGCGGVWLWWVGGGKLGGWLACGWIYDGNMNPQLEALCGTIMKLNNEEEKDDTPIPCSEDVTSPHQSSSTMLA
ncbi:Transcription factor E2F3 [Bienertia sinuspersici]